MRLIVGLLALVCASPLNAQAITSLLTPATGADLAAITAQIPVPASIVPPAETVGGAAGATMTFRRGDAVQPRISRTAVCTLTFTNNIGSCDATWDTSSFPAGTTVRLAGAPAVVTSSQGTSTEQPITCKAYNLSITGVSFRCWSSQNTVLSLAGVTAGLTLFPFIGTPAGTTVQVIALPSS